jgi:hypothetical protein
VLKHGSLERIGDQLFSMGGKKFIERGERLTTRRTGKQILGFRPQRRI